MSKPLPREVRSREVNAAIHKAGGGAELARKLTQLRHKEYSRQAVYQWRRVPAELVLAVEQFSGVPRHLLRPDLYPAPSVPLDEVLDEREKERAAS